MLETLGFLAIGMAIGTFLNHRQKKKEEEKQKDREDLIREIKEEFDIKEKKKDPD